MLAQLADLPTDPEHWAFEVKWDGIRAILFLEHGSLRIETRTGNDVTAQYPEFAGIAASLADHEAVLDGEIVAFDDRGRASFQRLQSRLGLTSPATIRERSASTPVHFVGFDLLELDGSDLRREPYEVRRAVLRDLLADGPAWRVPPHHVGAGEALFDAVVEQGLEGVVAKRLDSPYREGSRAGAWRKVKRQQRQEFVVCGWTEGAGRRAGSIGALLLAYHGDDGRLTYAGSVGTGFSDSQLAALHDLLRAIEVDSSPLESGSPDTESPGKWAAIRARERAVATPRSGRIHFARPELVAEVEFTEFTRDGTLRHPSFQGLRADKEPSTVVREDRA
jgi:bifunctional non-homologous end joining protein LigD